MLLYSLENKERPCSLKEAAFLNGDSHAVKLLISHHGVFKSLLLFFRKITDIPGGGCSSRCSRCGSGLGCALRLRCRCSGSFGRLTRKYVIQFFYDGFIVVITLIRGFADNGNVFLDSIQAAEQNIDHTRIDLQFPVTHLGENILHVVCQILHALKAHGTCHTFKGMRSTEYLAYGIRIFGILLEIKHTGVQILEMLLALIKEDV